MAYTRVQAVPNIMIDYQSFVLYNHISAEEKDIVSNAILTYVSVARKRGTENVCPFLQANVSTMAKEAFEGMIESIDEGINGYWKMCDKLSQNRGKAEKNSGTTNSRQVVDNSQLVVDNSQLVVDNSSTNSRQVVDIKKDVSTEGFMDGLTENYISYPTYIEQVIKLGRKDEYENIIRLLQNHKFNPTKEQCEDVANRMKFNELDLQLTVHCIGVCERRDKISMGQFFEVLKKINEEGWDGQVI